MDQIRLICIGGLILLTAAHSSDPDVVQEVRLSGGGSGCEGRVEVRLGSRWGTVCDEFSERSAEVICRQLGCAPAAGRVVRVSSFGGGSGALWLTGVTCVGEETSLQDCKYSIEEGDICDHRKDAGVLCSGEKEELRLVGGSSSCEGRVEVKHRGEWGTVCGLSWNRRSSAVVCRQAGCHFSNESQVKAASFGAGSGPVWLSHVSCTGEESSVWDCQHRMWGSGQCKHRDDAGVICSGAPDELRLVGGANKCEGRLEVKHKEEWGTVCGKYWQEKEAAVVCRQLGCDSAHEEPTVIRGTFFGSGSGPVWLSDVTCTGEEPDLWQCRHQMWGNPFCGHSWDVGVKCAGKPEEFKLVNGKTDCEGRLMVKHRETWGSVCGHIWGISEAQVVCRQLGCGSPQDQAKSTDTDVTPGVMWLSQVRCTGQEQSLMECNQRMWGLEECGHRHYIWVYCKELKKAQDCEKNGTEVPGSAKCFCTTDDGESEEFRIMSDSWKCSGMVEMRRNGTWKPLCSESWSHEDANVLCRQLGWAGAEAAPLAAPRETRGKMWTDAFSCHKEDAKLQKCARSATQKDCKGNIAAYAACTDKAETVRLKDGPNRCAGRLEILQDNIWEGVLHHLWGMGESEVVCKHLDCGHVIERFSLEELATNITGWNVTCEGHEENIETCSRSKVVSPEASSYPRNLVGVTCTGSRAVRLVGRPDQCGGVVEMYDQRKWKVVSGEAWSTRHGAVVCRELRCGHIITAGKKSVAGGERDWLNTMRCDGNEGVLRECTLVSQEPSGKEAATVICSEYTELRLAGTTNPCRGRLEIFYNGTWGSVCRNHMSSQSLAVICNELNCGRSGRLETPLKYGAGAAPYRLDHIDCGSNDSTFRSCPSAHWGENNCQAEEVSQITCEKSETSETSD